MNPTPDAAETLVCIATVVAMLQRSRASIYRDIAQGAFPKAVKLGRSSRWLRSEIAAHIQSLSEQRYTSGASPSPAKDAPSAQK